MKKIFIVSLTLLVLLLFSCDPLNGNIDERELAVAKYVVDDIERDLSLGFINRYSLDDNVDEHMLIISLSLDNAKVYKGCHVNLDISDERINYDKLEVVEGSIENTTNGKRIKSISDEGHEKIRVKISWKGNEFISSLYLNFRDNVNRKRYSYMDFAFVNGKLPWQE